MQKVILIALEKVSLRTFLIKQETATKKKDEKKSQDHPGNQTIE